MLKDSKTTIHLIRHAEAFNPRHIIYGNLPGFKLSKVGCFQAQKLKEYFAKEKIAVIFTSTLLRARKTAAILSDGKIPIKQSSKLVEADYKGWEGLPATERNINDLRVYAEEPTKLKVGETVYDIEKRMVKIIEDLLKKYQGKNIIIVTHGDPLTITRLHYQGKSFDLLNKVETKNASITSLIFNKKLKCEKVEYKTIVPAKEDLV